MSSAQDSGVLEKYSFSAEETSKLRDEVQRLTSELEAASLRHTETSDAASADKTLGASRNARETCTWYLM